MKNPYELTDKAIKLLNKRAVTRFRAAQAKMSKGGFDELNVIRTVKELYKELANDNHQIFLELAREQYVLLEPHGNEKPTAGWLEHLLLMYSPVTLYVYEHEVTRKRDYATESIIASKTKKAEIKKALIRWSKFTAEYADIVTDEATLKAFKDAGVKRVTWNTEEDDRVCEKCDPLNGKTFDIDKVPPKQHWGCRCWLTPA